jgi:hypothetical protein
VDAPGIGKSHAESWRQGYQGLFPSDTLGAAAEHRQEMWTADAFGFKDGMLLVAEEAGDISGFIHFGSAGPGNDIGEVTGYTSIPRTGDQGLRRRSCTRPLDR